MIKHAVYQFKSKMCPIIMGHSVYTFRQAFFRPN